jgi:hypothetical protein
MKNIGAMSKGEMSKFLLETLAELKSTLPLEYRQQILEDLKTNHADMPKESLMVIELGLIGDEAPLSFEIPG